MWWGIVPLLPPELGPIMRVSRSIAKWISMNFLENKPVLQRAEALREESLGSLGRV
jgi:hypothetical protein